MHVIVNLSAAAVADGRARAPEVFRGIEMYTVILLDIAGVLNPSVCPGSGGDRLHIEALAGVGELAKSTHVRA